MNYGEAIRDARVLTVPTGKVARDCPQCGERFYVHPCRTKRFCSHQCGVDSRRLSVSEYTRRYWWLVDTTTGQGPNGDCWGWTGGVNGDGYPVLGYPYNRALMAHRFSYVLAYGELPSGLQVLHRCDNPSCSKPEHLFLGTQTDNNLDMRNKGRQASKVSAEQVREMRSLYENGASIKSLCEQFGVKRHCVGGIVHRRFWKHIS